MCRRYMLFNDGQNEELARIVEEINFRLQDNPDAPKMKMGEIFPTDTVPILVHKNGRQSAHLAKWGFPKLYQSGVEINACGETLDANPMFRQSFYERRCIVPACGYLEWQKDGNRKIKHYIHTKDPLFYMAGLYNGYRDKGNKPYTGFVIVTTDPSNKISHIHDRMPSILPRDAAQKWMAGSDVAELKRLLVPYGGMEFEVAV